MSNKLIIAIDGPAASGKSTVASYLSKNLDLTHLQSSLLYRNLAKLCLAQNVNLTDTDEILNFLKITKQNDLLIKTKSNEEIGSASSKIAVYPKIRNFINKILRDIINHHSKLVIEGRDIGTVVSPLAQLKIFITASLEARSQRRYNQLKLTNSNISYKSILELLKERDQRDQERSSGPLVAASDAFIIDNSSLTFDETIEIILSYCQTKKITL